MVLLRLQGMISERGVPLTAHFYASFIAACTFGKWGKSKRKLQRAHALYSKMQGACRGAWTTMERWRLHPVCSSGHTTVNAGCHDTSCWACYLVVMLCLCYIV